MDEHLSAMVAIRQSDARVPKLPNAVSFKPTYDAPYEAASIARNTTKMPKSSEHYHCAWVITVRGRTNSSKNVECTPYAREPTMLPPAI
jgi:hypothetical protein